MDATAIFIIVIATALAIIFKLVIYHRIRGWMDQDLINGLADGDPAKLAYLQAKYQRLKADKVKRKHYHQQLTEFAEQFEQKT